MKVCIFGAGAIGGCMGGRMAAAGLDVSLVARGPHLVSMKKDGLRLEGCSGSQTVQVTATDNPADLGPQDFVIISVKAISLSGANIGPLLGPDTAVITAMNGIPWWYYYGLEGQRSARPLESVDPGGDFWRRIGPERAIGGIIGYSAEMPKPGVVRCVFGNRFDIGEPTGEMSERCLWLAELLNQSGFETRVSGTIRNDVWNKLLSTGVFNPLSALTRANLGTLANDADMRRLAKIMMREVSDVGTAAGGEFVGSIESRIDQVATLGSHKSSMLQDIEAGRPLELDAILGSICEMGRLVGVRTPSLDMILAVLKIRARHDYR
jgi:2-dehydropantoate 2-reductase